MFFNVLVVIIVGEEYFIFIIIGIKVLLDRLIFFIILFIKNVVFDIYLLFLNNDILKNNVNIKGKNGKVLLIFLIILLIISDLNYGLELDNILLIGVEI